MRKCPAENACRMPPCRSCGDHRQALHRVWFTIDGRPDQLEVGQAYEVNNQKQHSVANTSVEKRITFIFDCIPPGPLAYPSGQGRQRPA